MEVESLPSSLRSATMDMGVVEESPPSSDSRRGGGGGGVSIGCSWLLSGPNISQRRYSRSKLIFQYNLLFWWDCD